MIEAKPPLRIVDRPDLDLAVAQLRLIDPILDPLIDTLLLNQGPIPMRLRAPGFQGLAEIIVGQQVSKASAAAIFTRLCQSLPAFTAPDYLLLDEATLIETGLSRAKQATLLRLANNIVDGDIDLEELTRIAPEEAMNRLCDIKGIGPWTAEVFLMFCAGHADIFPAGDVALQQAIAEIYSIDKRPDTKQARSFSRRWQPVRGAAARVLWAHYAYIRQRKDLPV